MKTKLNQKRKGLHVIALAIIVAITLFSQTSTEAFTLIERPINFHTINVVKGQIIRLNVTNLGQEDISINFRFLNSDGLPVTEDFPSRALPGRTISIELNAGTIAPEEGRIQLRAVALVTGGKRNKLVGSMEIINALTGKTEFYLPAVQ